MTSQIRACLVDDHRLFRAGVIAELGTHVRIVGDAGDLPPGVGAADPELDQLTSREKEVLRKLQLSNRHELTAWAAGRDLL